MKCSACGANKLRRTERAIVLTGPGKLRPGRVCRACASTGWLLVMGDADGGAQRVQERTRKARERNQLVQELWEHAMAHARRKELEREGNGVPDDRDFVAGLRAMRAGMQRAGVVVDDAGNLAPRADLDPDDPNRSN